MPLSRLVIQQLVGKTIVKFTKHIPISPTNEIKLKTPETVTWKSPDSINKNSFLTETVDLHFLAESGTVTGPSTINYTFKPK